jgi:hypothetical protein
MLLETFPYGAIDNFVLLMADGIVLSQIASVYMFNQFSMRCILCLIPVLFMLFSCKQVFDILLYENEKGKKTNFVRLMGVHDSLYLILVFSLVVATLSTIDAIAHDWLFLLNCLYVPFFAMYTANRMMDDKQQKLAQSNCFAFQVFFTTLVFISLYLFI